MLACPAAGGACCPEAGPAAAANVINTSKFRCTFMTASPPWFARLALPRPGEGRSRYYLKWGNGARLSPHPVRIIRNMTNNHVPTVFGVLVILAALAAPATGRGARRLRRADLLDQVDPSQLVSAEEGRGADPDRARARSGVSRFARPDRVRQGPAHQGHPAAHPRPHGHGPPDPGPARHAARDRCGAAQGLS